MEIKKIRQKIHISQTELAEKLNIPRSTLAAWEVQKAEPRAKMIPYIADALGCSIDSLYGIERDESAGTLNRTTLNYIRQVLTERIEQDAIDIEQLKSDLMAASPEEATRIRNTIEDLTLDMTEAERHLFHVIDCAKGGEEE